MYFYLLRMMPVLRLFDFSRFSAAVVGVCRRGEVGLWTAGGSAQNKMRYR